MSLHGVAIFISKLLSMYHEKSNKCFKKSLVIIILNSFDLKMIEDKNPVYSTNIINFYRALSKKSR